MPTPSFLCDEMLHGLGRWLRVAGYDTLIATAGTPDRELLELALETGRIFITRDRDILDIRGADKAVLLIKQNQIEACISELNAALHIDWHYVPFSRCLVCNTLLTEAHHVQRLTLPQDIQASSGPVLYCTQCGKLFWEGSHVRRMRRRLDEFSQL